MLLQVWMTLLILLRKGRKIKCVVSKLKLLHFQLDATTNLDWCLLNLMLPLNLMTWIWCYCWILCWCWIDVSTWYSLEATVDSHANVWIWILISDASILYYSWCLDLILYMNLLLMFCFCYCCLYLNLLLLLPFTTAAFCYYCLHLNLKFVMCCYWCLW